MKKNSEFVLFIKSREPAVKHALTLFFLFLFLLYFPSCPKTYAGQAPVFQPVPDVTINPSLDKSTQVQFTVTASDPENTPVTLSLSEITRDDISISPGAIRDFLFTPATGILSWYPRPSACGIYTLRFKAQDQGQDTAYLNVKITVITPPICNGTDQICTFLKNEAIDPHGYTGIVYRNSDGWHATAQISWSAQMDSRSEGWGLQQFGFPGEITFTNSSTAYYALGGDNNAGAMNSANSNRLYNSLTSADSPLMGFYPGHVSDGRWGVEGHYAKNIYTFPAIGSSGSELSTIIAYMKTAGAFRGEVFEFLREHGALMTTLSFIDRFTRVDKEENRYMSLEAHPSFFSTAKLNPLEMVKTANAMTIEQIPPIARIKLTMWPDHGINGINYFEASSTNPARTIACLSPMSIATLYRDIHGATKVFEVDAADSSSPNGAAITEYNWVVIKGDPAHVRIIPKKPDYSRVRIEIDYHAEAPVPLRTDVFSNLVEVALFVRNANQAISVPAFFTSYSMRNETRVYENGRIKEVNYNENDVPCQTPPSIMLSHGKRWKKDVFNYDNEGVLQGSTRTMYNDAIINYTAEGRIIANNTEKNVEYTYNGSIRKIEPTAVEPALPQIDISPPEQTGTWGKTISFDVTITNRDSASCASDNFNLSGTVPPGWSSAFTPSKIDIPALGQGTVGWLVTIPGVSYEGTYTIEVAVSGSTPSVNHTGIGVALVSFSSSYVRYGDVSGDGEISAYDAALTAQAAVGLITLTPDQAKAADVNSDGRVSAYDAALIAQKAVGLIDRFPVEG